MRYSKQRSDLNNGKPRLEKAILPQNAVLEQQGPASGGTIATFIKFWYNRSDVSLRLKQS